MDIAARVGLSLGLLYCLSVVGTRGLALWYFRQSTPEAIQRAIEWDPRNPDYHLALAHFYERSFELGNLSRAILHYEEATRLNPRRARYWVELGGAYELAGQLDAARYAYERAQQLFPNSPRINWQLANFYLRTRRTRDGLRSLQKAIRGDAGLRRPAFSLAWRATDDAPLILDEMIPPEAEIFFPYLDYLCEQGKIDAAGQAWSRWQSRGVPFALEAAFPYLDALLHHRRVDELTAAWELLAERHPGRILPLRADTNLIANGSFENEILNGGLDWRVAAVEGAVVRVDGATFFDGARSLRIEFDGQHNLDYAQVLHYVPVQSNTMYRFSGYLRTHGITTDSGPRFEIYDAYNPAHLSLATDARVGTTSWQSERLEFRTGPETRLLVIRLRRLPSRKFDGLIAGTVWVDRVQLASVALRGAPNP